MSRVWAVRGAITLSEDSREELISSVQELIRNLLDSNGIGEDDLVSIIFTATDDVTSEFPAAAARLMGLGSVPLLCARELQVTSSLSVAMCVRVMIHCYAERRPSPVYLRGAARLQSPPDPA